VLPVINKDMRQISDLRVIEAVLFGILFPDILRYANGLFVSSSHEIVPSEGVAELLFQQNERVVFKLHTSRFSRGVMVYTKENFSVDEIIRAGNGVFQPYLRQHPFFDSFTANSVATLRLATVVDDQGEVSCRASYLRVARESDPIVIADTSLRIPVDVRTGQLHNKGYDSAFFSATQHPDSGFTFGGATIPGFAKSVEAVRGLHKKLPFCHSIGWDVCITQNEEPQIMEWNAKHNLIKVSEAASGPCFTGLGWENMWKGAI